MSEKPKTFEECPLEIYPRSPAEESDRKVFESGRREGDWIECALRRAFQYLDVVRSDAAAWKAQADAYREDLGRCQAELAGVVESAGEVEGNGRMTPSELMTAACAQLVELREHAQEVEDQRNDAQEGRSHAEDEVRELRKRLVEVEAERDSALAAIDGNAEDLTEYARERDEVAEGLCGLFIALGLEPHLAVEGDGPEAAVRQATERAEDMASALAVIAPYISLPSDLPPMEVVTKMLEAYQGVQAQAGEVRARLIRFAQWLQSDEIKDEGFRLAAAEGCVEQVDQFLADKRPIEQGPKDFFAEDRTAEDDNCNTCDGKGFVADEDVPEEGWTCRDCEGSGSELRATVRKLEAERKNYEARICKLEQYLAGERERAADAERQVVHQAGEVEQRTAERDEAIKVAHELRTGIKFLTPEALRRLCETIDYVHPWALKVDEEPDIRRYKPKPLDVDALANFIRSIDGKHEMGAAELGERIAEWWSAPDFKRLVDRG